ncbi:DNA-binding transcriptional regulator, LysR family [Streptomyces sp. 2131.1]|uniref:LysR family transcriptional regulator n=1 Tax=Streptomyces sp. 2131.1 TaxID=1855346 RepID=UPI0008966AED|nr:LysR family transcriptional regulator [Streptomyces sp. 2131.1]SEE50454.1 DNA-binding transcriptional regulator, LysR family [Streptomyces sp. 2131.1]
MQLELRHLEAVLQVAEAGSVGRAAARLGVSQPALSAQLRRIERVAGGELFVRSASGVAPTPLGEFVLSAARRVLGEMDALTAGTRAAAPHPTLRLGCILLVLVDQLFGRLETELPDHEIDITIEHSAPALMRMLQAGQYDAILFGEVADHEVPLTDGVAVRTLIPKEPACVRLSASHPLAGQKEIELADLAGETWTTLTDDGDGGPEAMTDACRRAGFTPKLRYRIADRRMRWELIAAGRAVSLCQPTSPHVEGTVLRPLAGDPIIGRIRLAWNRAAISEPRAGLLFRAVARAYLDSIPNNTFFQAWWESRPELHPAFD